MKQSWSGFFLGFIALLSLSQISFAKWTLTNGPKSDWVNALAVNGNTIFAGTDNFAIAETCGVYLSTDNGTNWNNIHEIPRTAVYAFTITDNNIFVLADYGLYFSNDNGTGWKSIGNGICRYNMSAWSCDILSLVAVGNTFLAGTHAWGGGAMTGGGFRGGIYASSDTGTTWTPVNTGLPNAVTVNSLLLKDSIIIAGTSNGVFSSTNKGANWSASNNGFSTDTTIRTLVKSGSGIFAGTDGGRVFVSTDNCRSWKSTSAGLPSRISVSAFALTKSNIFASTTGAGVFLSTNNGITWNAVNDGFNSNANIYSLAANDTYIFAGAGDGTGIWSRKLSEIVDNVLSQQKGTVRKPAGFRVQQSGENCPKATIELFLPSSIPVTIALYDISGHQLASIFDGHLQSGTHRIIWNMPPLAKSYYIVKMRAGQNVFVQGLPYFQ